jgi:vacuolar-type H+-ATPase subunit I/STV1
VFLSSFPHAYKSFPFGENDRRTIATVKNPSSFLRICLVYMSHTYIETIFWVGRKGFLYAICPVAIIFLVGSTAKLTISYL